MKRKELPIGIHYAKKYEACAMGPDDLIVLGTYSSVRAAVTAREEYLKKIYPEAYRTNQRRSK
jgi:hypothetical protein